MGHDERKEKANGVRQLVRDRLRVFAEIAGARGERVKRDQALWFVIDALGDTFSHTYETFRLYLGPRNDPTSFRFGPSITTGYPEYIGHGLNGTWPDIIRNSPHRYVDFLRSVQTAMFPFQDIRALKPLTSHILNPDDPVHVQVRSTYPNARQLTQMLTGDALSEYQSELIDPHSLTIKKGEPYTLPDGPTIKKIISLMKCRCAK